jgi:hypothetical protein
MEDYSITLFSFGAGQESTYFLHRLGTDPAFYAKHVSGFLIVIGSDTGDEHDHTYENIKWCQQFCREKRILFYWITKDMGYHGRTWQSLFEQYKRTSTIGSASFQQTCTSNLKVKVVDRFFEEWIKTNYGYEQKNKQAIIKFVEETGGLKIKYILCFAAGEESRTANGNKYDGVWKKKTCDRRYPLIEIGVGRQECIDYNSIHIPHIVWPSNCMRCFYMSDQEIVWLQRFYPAKFIEWVEVEKAKLIKWWHKGLEQPPKNYGVYGLITLEQKLEKALAKYGDWSDERLNEYKMSHGHCIKTKY